MDVEDVLMDGDSTAGDSDSDSDSDGDSDGDGDGDGDGDDTLLTGVGLVPILPHGSGPQRARAAGRPKRRRRRRSGVIAGCQDQQPRRSRRG
jgi:hypothetical protein